MRNINLMLQDFKRTSNKADYQEVDVRACRRSPIRSINDSNCIAR